MTVERQSSASHLVLIPSYNSGRKLVDTVSEARRFWQPVWVIIDGSTDGSDRGLSALAAKQSGLNIIRLAQNNGKGAAVLAGLGRAAQQGFRFALVMDADGQHPAARIGEFMALSAENPDAMILGVPQFGPEAPKARRNGRRIGNWWTNFETLWGGIADSLFGFRVYPIQESIKILERIRSGRGYDFDTVLAVRLFWSGVRPVNRPVPVRYLRPEEGGVSHFRYVGDNLLLTRAHAVLLLAMLARLPRLIQFRRSQIAFAPKNNVVPAR